MKALLLITIFFLNLFANNVFAQGQDYSEKYGKTLNMGLGVGYFGYIGHSTPAFHINYEFDVAKSFTLAPFASIFSYQRVYNHNGNRYYSRHTVIPVGVKGTYYFDKLFEAGPKWDFYAAGSLGFVMVNSHYDDRYYYDKDKFHRVNPLFLDIHVGAEYHINSKLGIFLDLSTGMSTVGIAIHN
jgi:hypothetical protein